MAFIEPVTLTGDHATLEPLAREHEAALRERRGRRRAVAALVHVGRAAGQIGGYIARPRSTCASARRDAVRRARSRTGEIVGCTRYFNVDAANRRLEIGHTWYAKRVQRTAINTECKLLLLTHAFEVLRCIAVEFRTHWFNHASRAAIARLGAKQDGVLRNHQLLARRRRRDTVVFSIIDGEWPAVKRHLGPTRRPRARTAAACSDAMLIDFFLHLKSAKLPVCTREFLDAARSARSTTWCRPASTTSTSWRARAWSRTRRSTTASTSRSVPTSRASTACSTFTPRFPSHGCAR